MRRDAGRAATRLTFADLFEALVILHAVLGCRQLASNARLFTSPVFVLAKRACAVENPRSKVGNARGRVTGTSAFDDA